MYVALSYIPLRVTKPLSRIIDNLSFLLCAEGNEENITVSLFLNLYSCIPDPLFCLVADEDIPVFYMELTIGR